MRVENKDIIDYAVNLFDVHFAEIREASGTYFLYIGMYRCTSQDGESVTYVNGIPTDYLYSDLLCVGSSDVLEELPSKADEYKRMTEMAALEYFSELLGVEIKSYLGLDLDPENSQFDYFKNGGLKLTKEQIRIVDDHKDRFGIIDKAIMEHDLFKHLSRDINEFPPFSELCLDKKLDLCFNPFTKERILNEEIS